MQSELTDGGDGDEERSVYIGRFIVEALDITDNRTSPRHEGRS